MTGTSDVVDLVDEECSPFFFSCRQRQVWRCSNCKVWGNAVWAVRDGAAGPKVSSIYEVGRMACPEFVLTFLRLSALIVVSFMNETRSLLSGPRICIVMIYLLADDQAGGH